MNGVAIPKIGSSGTYLTEVDLNDLDRIQNEINQLNICTTDICVKESARIRNSLNVSVEPCENFYDFVCEKYIHDTVLPENKYKESAFSLVQDRIDKQMMDALFEETKPDEPNAFKLAKMFTKICMDEATLNAKGNTLQLNIR